MEPEAPAEEAPEALLEVRRRVREAEGRGVDVAESKRLLVSALLAFRARKLDEMGECVRGASKALEEGEKARREEVLRKQLWTLREEGMEPERLTSAEAALNERNLPGAEAALAALRGGGGARARAPLIPSDLAAALSFESRTFTLVLGAGGGGSFRPLDVRRGEAAPEELDGAIVAALKSLRPRPSVVHVALPHASHVLAPVSLPPDLPDAERMQAVRWKLAKLCDLAADDVEVRSRPLGAGGATLGLMSLGKPVRRILAMVSAAGIPVGRILPPSETLRLLLPQGAPRETRAVLEIRRDSAQVYLYGASNLAFSRDLGVGSALWLEVLGTPVSSARGMIHLTDRQAREVLERFDISRPEDLVLEDGSTLGGQDILSLLRPSLERLQDALARSVDHSGTLEGLTPVTSVTLCGEGASLRGLGRVLTEHVGIPVSPLDLGALLPSPSGLSVLSPSDALAASLLAVRERSPFDLAPAFARSEAVLSRASRPVLGAAAVATALCLGLGGYSLWEVRSCHNQLEAMKQDFETNKKRRLSEDLSSRPVSHPPGSESPGGRILRELSLALPSEAVLRKLTLQAPVAGGGAVLDLEAEPGCDLSAVLSGHPLFSAAAEQGEGRLRCTVPEGRLK